MNSLPTTISITIELGNEWALGCVKRDQKVRNMRKIVDEPAGAEYHLTDVRHRTRCSGVRLQPVPNINLREVEK